MSLFYGIGVKARNASLYGRGKQLPGFVLSVGNMTTGGTGKTPAVIMLARWAESQGYNIAVLSRGYGGKNNKEAAVVSDRNNILLPPEISGDEPWLIANSLKNIPVIISRKRYLAGLMALDNFGSNFFILDDGFQHIHLKRDIDIVLADAKKPFGNGHLLPWGPLREPISGLKRADVILLTRSQNMFPEYNMISLFKKPVITGEHVSEKIYFPFSNKYVDLSFLKGKRVVAFSGIARPESFKESLLNLGAEIISFKRFADHYPYNRKNIESLRRELHTLNGEFLVTTEKDWARIHGITVDIKNLALLSINLVITTGKDQFFKMIKQRADAVLGLKK